MLFLRCALDLIEDLDKLVAQELAAHPVRGVSRADVARELLYEAVRARLAQASD